MSYKITTVNTNTAFDSVNNYYQGSSTGSLFFRSPTADDPYHIVGHSAINGVLYDSGYLNGYCYGDMLITNTRVTPYFANYKVNDKPLLLGDEDHYVISGVGWTTDSYAENTDIYWRGPIAISGPELSNEFLYNKYKAEFQFYYYNSTDHCYYYYRTSVPVGEGHWTTSEQTSDVYLSNGQGGYSGFCIILQKAQLESTTNVWYTFKIRLVNQDHPSRVSPWVGFQIKFGSKTVDGHTTFGKPIYCWHPELASLAGGGVTIPYASTYITGYYFDYWQMIPTYGDHIITNTRELDWDW